MAGTPRIVRLTGKPSADVLALADSVNRFIADFDSHTHAGVTVGSGSSHVPSTLTTASPIEEAMDTDPNAVYSVQVFPTTIAMQPGEFVHCRALTLGVSQQIIRNIPLVWSSADTDIATVDGAGKVTMVAPGVTSIRATYDGRVMGSNVVIVEDTPSHPSDVMRSVLATAPSTRKVTLEYSTLSTPGRYQYLWTPLGGTAYWLRWWMRKEITAVDASNMTGLIGVNVYRAYEGYSASGGTFGGSWTGPTTSTETLGGKYWVTNGASVGRTFTCSITANSAGELYIVHQRLISLASVDVTIDGGTALVNELPDVGGAKRLNMWASSTAEQSSNVFTKIASGLTPSQSYTVVCTTNGTNLGGGTNVRINGWAVPSGSSHSIATALVNSEEFIVTIIPGGVNEYAIACQPVGTTVAEVSGLGHGHEMNTGSDYLDQDGNVLVVSTLVPRVDAETIELRQFGYAKHSQLPGANIAEIWLSHVFHQDGMDCFHRHRWLCAGTIGYAYASMCAGWDATELGQIAGNGGQSYSLLSGTGQRFGELTQRAAAMWSESIPYVLSFFSPNFDGIANWTYSQYKLWIQDRAPGTSNKFYYERNGASLAGQIAPGDIWHNVAWYRIGRFDDPSAVLPVPDSL